jgi:hypothetical protein
MPVLLALMISGCASGGSLSPQPSPGQLATPAKTQAVTAVAVSRRCAALARKVAPPPYQVGDNPKVVLKRYEAALAEANANLGATGSCIERLSAQYAVGLR